jgi:preprotein translocase subunit SecG
MSVTLLKQALPYVQVGVSILLIAVILLQQKGEGLSSAFGGSGGFYRTKRGFEKTLFISTIVLATLFVGIGIVLVFLNRTA